MNPNQNWREEVAPEERKRVIEKILITLRECVTETHSDQSKLMNLAARFEESVYKQATNKTQYFHMIANKMYSLKAKNKKTDNPPPSGPLPTNPFDSNQVTTDPSMNPATMGLPIAQPIVPGTMNRSVVGVAPTPTTVQGLPLAMNPVVNPTGPAMGGFPTHTNVGLGVLPLGMSNEEKAYWEKHRSLQQYIKPLATMIKQIEKLITDNKGGGDQEKTLIPLHKKLEYYYKLLQDTPSERKYGSSENMKALEVAERQIQHWIQQLTNPAKQQQQHVVPSPTGISTNNINTTPPNNNNTMMNTNNNTNNLSTTPPMVGLGGSGTINVTTPPGTGGGNVIGGGMGMNAHTGINSNVTHVGIPGAQQIPVKASALGQTMNMGMNVSGGLTSSFQPVVGNQARTAGTTVNLVNGQPTTTIGANPMYNSSNAAAAARIVSANAGMLRGSGSAPNAIPGQPQVGGVKPFSNTTAAMFAAQQQQTTGQPPVGTIPSTTIPDNKEVVMVEDDHLPLAPGQTSAPANSMNIPTTTTGAAPVPTASATAVKENPLSALLERVSKSEQDNKDIIAVVESMKSRSSLKRVTVSPTPVRADPEQTTTSTSALHDAKKALFWWLSTKNSPPTQRNDVSGNSMLSPISPQSVSTPVVATPAQTDGLSKRRRVEGDQFMNYAKEEAIRYTINDEYFMPAREINNNKILVIDRYDKTFNDNRLYIELTPHNLNSATTTSLLPTIRYGIMNEELLDEQSLVDTALQAFPTAFEREVEISIKIHGYTNFLELYKNYIRCQETLEKEIQKLTENQWKIEKKYEKKSFVLLCSPKDQNGLTTPPLQVMVPLEYPQRSPKYRFSHEQELFLSEAKKKMECQMRMQVNPFSLTVIVQQWQAGLSACMN